MINRCDDVNQFAKQKKINYPIYILKSSVKNIVDRKINKNKGINRPVTGLGSKVDHSICLHSSIVETDSTGCNIFRCNTYIQQPSTRRLFNVHNHIGGRFSKYVFWAILLG